MDSFEKMKRHHRLGGHIKRHSKNFANHMKKHHRKYILGGIGGALVFKLFTLIIASGGIYHYAQSNATKADFESGVTITVSCVGLFDNSHYFGNSTSYDINQTDGVPSQYAIYSSLATEGTCEFSCNDGYTRGGASCDLDTPTTQTGSCVGLPNNAHYFGNTIDYIITQTVATGGREPTLNASHNAGVTEGTCEFSCDSNYVWSGEACSLQENNTGSGDYNEENTITTGACTNLASNAHFYGNTTNYIVTLSGGLPSLIGTYTGGTLIEGICEYNCNTDYTWSGDACVEDGSFNENVNNTGNDQTGNVCSTGLTLNNPLNGSFVGGIFSIQRTSCNITTFVIDLWDHNSQWLNIGTVNGATQTGLVRDSKLLAGIYDAGGILLSGFYTVTGNNPFTGSYTGLYTSYSSGYKIRITDQNGNIVYSGGTFTIDNLLPTLSNITFQTLANTTGYVGLGTTVKLSFVANEPLTGLVVNIGGTGAILFYQSGLNYVFTQTLSNQNTEGNLTYNISFSDFIGNTGYVTNDGELIFDKTVPSITGLTFVGSYTGMTVRFISSENTKYIIKYRPSNQSSSGAKTFTSTQYLVNQSYFATGLSRLVTYKFNVTVLDMTYNNILVTGSFYFTSTGVHLAYNITSGTVISTPSVVTGSLVTLAVTLRNEIEKFNSCRSALDYDIMNITIGRSKYRLEMPKFQKSYVKKIVSAFALLIIDKVEGNKSLTNGEIEEITKKFDNFLIVLKLIRDDDNECKQNLSNYHILQFQKALEEYKLYFK